MKKIIGFIVMAVMLIMSSVVFAGDVPESLLSEDNAKVFIGSVENFTTKQIEGSSQFSIETVEVTPTVKLKGEVKIGEKEIYTRCESVLDLQKGKEYLFGYIDENNFYIYEIESMDEKTVRLADADKYDMTKRLENYINEGAFAMAEQERASIGTQISFAEFLYKKPSLSSSGIEKVILRYQDEVHEVDKDEFFKTAETIMITNVKNDTLYDVKSNPNSTDAYKTVLYIELLDANDQLCYYGAVSRFGEVDNYGLFMGRLMCKDYEMSREDLLKLYSLFPKKVQKEIKAPEKLPADEPLEVPIEPENNYIGLIVAIVIVIYLIAFAIGYRIRRKNKNSKNER